jgi:hypothetical protein
MRECALLDTIEYLAGAGFANGRNPDDTLAAKAVAASKVQPPTFRIHARDEVAFAPASVVPIPTNVGFKSAKLFEEKRDPGVSVLIAKRARPILVHWPRAYAPFATDNNPIEA